MLTRTAPLPAPAPAPLPALSRTRPPLRERRTGSDGADVPVTRDGWPVRVMHSPWVDGTRNPYVALWIDAARRAGVQVEPFSTRAALRSRPAVVHVNWPEVALRHRSSRTAAWNLAKVLVSCALVRARGSRIVWTAHNLSSHERRHPLLEQLLWRTFCPMVSGVHSLSRSGVAQVRARFPIGRSPVFVVPHGHYGDVLAPTQRVEPTYDVGMVGAVRRYKDHEAVLRLLPQLPAPAPRVLIAGPAADNVLLRDLHALPGAADVHWELAEHDERTFQRLVQSCRLVVVAQTSALNSGSLLYALSCGRPVLAPDTATFRELQEVVGEQWLMLFDGRLSAPRLAEAMAAARRLAADAAPDLDAVDWDVLGGLAAQMYASVAR